MKEDVTNNAISFGELVMNARTQKDMSLQGLVDELNKRKGENVTKSYLSRIERNERLNPSFKLVCALAEVLQLNLNEVLASLDCGSLISEDLKYNGIEQMIRFNDIIAPVLSERKGQPDRAYLTPAEKEVLIRILNDTFLLASVPDDQVILQINYILNDLDQYRKKRYETLCSILYSGKKEDLF